VPLSRIAQVVVVILAALAVYGFVSSARDGETRRVCTPLCALRPDYAARNRLAPDFELPKLGGGTARLSAYRGRAVVLNFWTKSCRPCLEEMPSIAGLAKAIAPHPELALLTVTTDDTLDDARDTLRAVLGTDPPFVVMLDPDAKVVGGKFGTKLYPETWFIDKTGVIRARVDGGREWTSALTIDVLHSLDAPVECGIAFKEHEALGPLAGICGEPVGG
jgi:thiol-disulfide isomerase/thioredoxin